MARCLPATPLGPRVTLALPRGASLTYQESLDSSSKQPLVLLHGLGMTADLNWGATYAELSRLFRVVAPDLPGHGRGVHPWPNFSLEECADHIVALADSLGIDRFIACGYSMGSLIADCTAGLAEASRPGLWARSRCHFPQLPRISRRAPGLVVLTGLRRRRPHQPSFPHTAGGRSRHRLSERPR